MICVVFRFRNFCLLRNFFSQNSLRKVCGVCLLTVFFLHFQRKVCVACRFRSFCLHRNFFSQNSLRKICEADLQMSFFLRKFFFHCVLRKSVLRCLKNVRFLVSCGRCRLFCCLPFSFAFPAFKVLILFGSRQSLFCYLEYICYSSFLHCRSFCTRVEASLHCCFARLIP